MRRVLILTYTFPPSCKVGAFRPLAFATHLREAGWEPVVLTTRPAAGEQTDPSLAQHLPVGIRVVRTRPLGAPAKLAGLHRRSGLPAGVSRVLRRARSLVAPDAQIRWWLLAVPAALRLHRSVGFDLILATAPPNSTLVIGRHLKRLTARPLVVDLRDPWTEQLDGIRRAESARRKAREAAMERTVFEDADAIVVTAPELEARIAARVPELASKLRVISNGYDPTASDGVDPVRFDRFAVVYTGKIMIGYDPRPFLRAVAMLEDPSAIEVHLIGPIDPALRHEIATGELAQIVRIHGPLPHREALAHQLGADLLLAVLAPGWEPSTIASKLFEYMQAGAPVLAVMDPDCASARLVERTGIGFVHPPHATGAIGESLAGLVLRGRLSRAERSAPPPEYDRRRLTERLARVLDEAVAGHAARRG